MTQTAIIERVKLEQALEALKEVYWSSRGAKHDEAIATIKEALSSEAMKAQPEQEPIGKVVGGVGTMRKVKWASGLLPPAGARIYITSPQRKLTDARLIDCAKRLVEHADFQLGGSLSAESKAKDIPSKAMSQVKARHLAALRDALSAHDIKESV